MTKASTSYITAMGSPVNMGVAPFESMFNTNVTNIVRTFDLRYTYSRCKVVFAASVVSPYYFLITWATVANHYTS